ncbi:MAG: hypothetical protein M3360_04225 [Actinomycetota bacterium]|nr:hypothetical protein [Actinomycetota bacterium]
MASEFLAEDIGLLTTKVDIPGWLQIGRTRFDFLSQPTDEEKKWAACNPGDTYSVRRVIENL